MSNKSTLSLPQRLDINEASSLKDRMNKALEKDATTFDVKADSVEHVDSAGMQLLISFKNAVNSSGKKMNLTNPSDNFKTEIELLGATELLALD